MNIGILSNLLKENSINNNKIVGNSLEKLSTGLRINKAADDASGLAISDKLRTQATGIKQAINNANSAIAMMNIADKAMSEMSNILDIIKAKSIQMNTDTTSEEGRKILKTEILKLIDSYDNIACQTTYNKTPLLTGCASPFDFQVGANSNDLISVDINNIQSRQMGQADPFKLKNFITGFNDPTLPTAPFNKEEISFKFESTGVTGPVNSYVVTENPPNLPLYIEDRALAKIGIYSMPTIDVADEGTTKLFDYYKDQGFSIEKYNTSNSLDSYSLDINLLFIQLPTREFNNDEIEWMSNFLDNGGRIFFVGEYNSDFSRNYNNNISNTISSLGGGMRILENFYDDELNTHTNLDGKMNLNNSPLLGGVSTFMTDAYASLEVQGDLTKPIIVDDNNRIVMAEQAISKGKISLIADINWFTYDNSPANNNIYQNNVFMNNLVIDSYINSQYVISGKNPNTDDIIYTFSDKEPYSSLKNENISCQCDVVELIRNDEDPTLLHQAMKLMEVVDESLTQLNSQRANVGAGTNQLEISAKNMMTSYVNVKSAESVIRDLDYASESANFNKANIISQAGSFVQSQANNIDKQYVTQLLK